MLWGFFDVDYFMIHTQQCYWGYEEFVRRKDKNGKCTEDLEARLEL